MKLLYVHERFGALAGAEANAFITAQELGGRGHEMGILHGPGTGKNEAGWEAVFGYRQGLADEPEEATRRALKASRSGWPVARRFISPRTTGWEVG